MLIDLKDEFKLTLLFMASAKPWPKVSVLTLVVVKDDLTPFITIVYVSPISKECAGFVSNV